MDERQYRMAADWAASAYDAWRDQGESGTFCDWVRNGVGVPMPPTPYDYYTADGTQVGYATDPELLAGEYGCDLPTLERAIAEVQPGVPPELRLDSVDLTDEWMERLSDYLLSGGGDLLDDARLEAAESLGLDGLGDAVERIQAEDQAALQTSAGPRL